MRVVVINDASVARGGATGLALASIRGFHRRGVDVTFIAGDGGDNADLKSTNVETVRVGGRPILERGRINAFVSGLYNPAAEELITQWITKFDTNSTVYHLHGWSKILSPSVLSALRPVAKRTVIHAHDFFLSCPNGAFMDYPRMQVCERVPLSVSCLATNCDRRSYLQKLWRASRQVAVKRSLNLSHCDWAKIILIHEKMIPFFTRSGFAPSRLMTLRNPAEPFWQERILAEDNTRFCFVGRLEGEKGIEDALEAARVAGVRLDVVGDGPLRMTLEARFPEAAFHGWKSRSEIGYIVSNSRALVMPSRYAEPFGLAAAEATKSGLPVILTTKAFLADEFVEKGIGLACETENIASLASCFTQMARMPKELISAMSQRAYSSGSAVALNEVQWTDALLETYSGLLN